MKTVLTQVLTLDYSSFSLTSASDWGKVQGQRSMKSLYDALHPEETPKTQENPSGEAKLTAKSFARGIVDSEEYRHSIFVRVVNGTLPPAVECRILDHALGKPVEHVEVKDRTERAELTEADIQKEIQRAEYLLSLFRASRTNDAVHASSSDADDGPTPSFVH